MAYIVQFEGCFDVTKNRRTLTHCKSLLEIDSAWNRRNVFCQASAAVVSNNWWKKTNIFKKLLCTNKKNAHNSLKCAWFWRSDNGVQQTSEILLKSVLRSVRRRGKNVDASSKSNPLRRRGKKITTRRREGVGVVVEKKEESRRTFNKNSCDLLTAITHTTFKRK